MEEKKNGNRNFNNERFQLKHLDGNQVLDKIDVSKDDIIVADKKVWQMNWKDIKDKRVAFIDERLYNWRKAR